MELYAYTHIYIYIYMYVCIYICIYVRIYVYIHIYIHTHTYIYIWRALGGVLNFGGDDADELRLSATAHLRCYLWLIEEAMYVYI